MKKSLATLATAALLVATGAAAEEHLVSREAAQQRLFEVAVQRERNLATVDAFVASPEGSVALATVGLDTARVRSVLGTLSDSELQELAFRAAALDTDPTAGAPFSRRQIVWIAAIALAVVLLIILIA